MRTGLAYLASVMALRSTNSDEATAGGAPTDAADNPSFPLTMAQARTDLARMRSNRLPLARPVVIIAGFMDLQITTAFFRWFIRGIADRPHMVSVSPGFCQSFGQCRRAVVNAVQKHLPTTDPNQTTEVDVVGISLGGLAARYAAVPYAGRRLRIRRLLTISSPHTGAILAKKIALTRFHRQMRPGSEFLAGLARFDAEAEYDLIPYVLLGDETVGQDYAAPPGRIPYWLRNESWLPLGRHITSAADHRILADIARRLRGETPYTLANPSPLPGNQ